MEAARVSEFLIDEKLPMSATEPALDCDTIDKLLSVVTEI